MSNNHNPNSIAANTVHLAEEDRHQSISAEIATNMSTMTSQSSVHSKVKAPEVSHEALDGDCSGGCDCDGAGGDSDHTAIESTAPEYKKHQVAGESAGKVGGSGGRVRHAIWQLVNDKMLRRFRKPKSPQPDDLAARLEQKRQEKQNGSPGVGSRQPSISPALSGGAPQSGSGQSTMSNRVRRDNSNDMIKLANGTEMHINTVSAMIANRDGGRLIGR